MKKYKLIDTVSFVLLVISITVMRLLSRYAENIIYGKKFIWNYFIAGLTISILWLYLFYKKEPDYFNSENKKRASALIAQCFSIIILTIFIFVFYTYYTGKDTIYYKTVIAKDKGDNIKTGSSYVHLVVDGREERFSPTKSEYDKINKSDSIILTIGRGKTNYDFIYEFNKK